MDSATSEKQEKLRNFVNREVLHCVTSWVEDSFKAGLLSYDDIENSYSLPDDIYVQWFDNTPHLETGYYTYSAQHRSLPAGDQIGPFDTEGEAWEEARNRWEEPQEIYEWWLVTSFMYKDLLEFGEPVMETDYGYLWGRTCTGQAIYCDGVIERIYDSLGDKNND